MRLIFIIQVFSYLLRRYSFLFYRGKIQINFPTNHKPVLFFCLLAFSRLSPHTQAGRLSPFVLPQKDTNHRAGLMIIGAQMEALDRGTHVVSYPARIMCW